MSEPETDQVTRPDDLIFARLGRLVLLLQAAPGQPYQKPWDVERVATYDFFADNPLLLFPPGTPEYRDALLAGFDAQSLSYNSASQRFSNRRSRLQHDLAHLLARGSIRARTDGGRVVYELTDSGRALADDLTSVYAQAYRASAKLVAKNLNRLSNKALRERTSEVLRAESFLIDLDLNADNQ